MRTATNIISLFIVTVALAVGQLLFKRVALDLRGESLSAIKMIIVNPSLYYALAVYGSATLLWIWLLSRIPLSQAYPWVALSVIVVPLMSWQFLGERLNPVFWVGLFLIFTGLLLTQFAVRGG